MKDRSYWHTLFSMNNMDDRISEVSYPLFKAYPFDAVDLHKRICATKYFTGGKWG